MGTGVNGFSADVFKDWLKQWQSRKWLARTLGGFYIAGGV
jgi:hypothetical protein